MTTAPTPPFAAMFAKPDEIGDPASVLLYAKPGRWKTSTAGSIVRVPKFKDARILYLDVDQGSKVFVNDPDVYAGVQAGRINIIPINKLDPEAFAQLQYFLGKYDENGVFQRGEAFKWGYDVVVLDTLDVAQDIAINWFMNNTVSEKTGKKDTLGAWGRVAPWTTDVMWALQNDPSAFGIVVMHSAEDVSETGMLAIKPKLGGSAKDNIGGIPDMVAYLDFEANPENKDDVRLVAHVGKSNIFTTKNRWRTPDKIVDFDMPTLFGLIESRRNETHAQAQAKTQSTKTPAAAAA